VPEEPIDPAFSALTPCCVESALAIGFIDGCHLIAALFLLRNRYCIGDIMP
jgi:hypothetical protein